MSDDLSALIRAAVDSETEGAARTHPYVSGTFEELRGRARRRRAVGAVSVATACALVVGAAAVAVGQPWSKPLPPATTTSPDPRSTEPSPAPSDLDVIETVTVDPHLPQAQPLRAGVLAGTGAGWAMFEYNGTVDAESGPVEGPHILYLLAPDGSLTQVADLTDADESMRLLDWLPGTGRVLMAVSASGDGGSESVRVLDLETGKAEGEIALGGESYGVRASFTRPTGRNVAVWSDGPDGASLVRYSASGEKLTTLVEKLSEGAATSNGYLYGPDGTFVVVGAGTTFEAVPVDGSKPTTLPLPDGTIGCAPVRWWPDGRLLATCADDLGPDVANDPDGTLGTRLTAENAWLFDVSHPAAAERLTAYASTSVVDFGIEDVWDVAGTRYARWAGDCGGMSLGVADGAAYTSLADGVWAYGPWHDGFLAASRPSCGDPYAELVSVARDGSVTTLVPRVEGAYGISTVVLP